MNILDLAVSTESFLLAIKHPVTGKDITLEDNSTMSVTLFSSDAGTSKVAFESMKRKMRALIGKDEEIDAESYAKIYAEAVVSCCESINIDPDFERADNIDLLANSEYTWLLDQITRAMDNRANFMMD